MSTTDSFMWDSFQKRLVKSGKVKENTASSINWRINRIKEVYPIEYEYAKEGWAELLEDFTYTAEDAKNRIIPNVHIKISGSYHKGLHSLKRALVLCVEYLDNYIPKTPAKINKGCILKETSMSLRILLVRNSARKFKLLQKCQRNK